MININYNMHGSLIIVNPAITMFTLVTVDVNLCYACKKSINNTQNEVERHPGPDIQTG